MLFFEMEYKADSSFETKTKRQEKLRDDRIRKACAYYYERISQTMRFDIVQINECTIILAVAVTESNKDDIIKKANEFLEKLEVNAKLIDMQESTMYLYMSDIQTSIDNQWTNNRQFFTGNFDSRSFLRRYGSDSRIKESLIDETESKEEAIERARKLMCVPTLELEIERIFQGKSKDMCFAQCC